MRIWLLIGILLTAILGLLCLDWPASVTDRTLAPDASPTTTNEEIAVADLSIDLRRSVQPIDEVPSGVGGFEIDADEDTASRPLEPTQHSRILSNARQYYDSYAINSAKDQATAAQVLLTVCISTILDARGDFTVVAGSAELLNIPPECHCLTTNGRRYVFRIDEFPEFSELLEIVKGRGKTVLAEDAQKPGSRLDSTLALQIQLRYEEASAIAESMR